MTRAVSRGAMIACDVGLATLAADYDGVLSRSSSKDRKDLRTFANWLNAMAEYAANRKPGRDAQGGGS